MNEKNELVKYVTLKWKKCIFNVTGFLYRDLNFCLKLKDGKIKLHNRIPSEYRSTNITVLYYKPLIKWIKYQFVVRKGPTNILYSSH